MSNKVIASSSTTIVVNQNGKAVYDFLKSRPGEIFSFGEIVQGAGVAKNSAYIASAKKVADLEGGIIETIDDGVTYTETVTKTFKHTNSDGSESSNYSVTTTKEKTAKGYRYMPNEEPEADEEPEDETDEEPAPFMADDDEKEGD